MPQNEQMGAFGITACTMWIGFEALLHDYVGGSWLSLQVVGKEN